jgi:hypothetical protein
METVTSKTKTTGGLPDEDTPTTENILMETEEGPVGQALVPEKMGMVRVAAEALNLDGATTTTKDRRDPEESSSST